MTTDEGGKPSESARRRAHRSKAEAPPFDLESSTPPLPSPSARLDEMTRRRIASLERDKKASGQRAAALQSSIDVLSPENARLREALGNAQANGTFSAILTNCGGAAVGLAGFAGKFSGYVATAGGVAMSIGLVLSIMSGVRLRNVSRTTVEK